MGPSRLPDPPTPSVNCAGDDFDDWYPGCNHTLSLVISLDHGVGPVPFSFGCERIDDPAGDQSADWENDQQQPGTERSLDRREPREWNFAPRPWFGLGIRRSCPKNNARRPRLSHKRPPLPNQQPGLPVAKVPAGELAIEQAVGERFARRSAPIPHAGCRGPPANELPGEESLDDALLADLNSLIASEPSRCPQKREAGLGARRMAHRKGAGSSVGNYFEFSPNPAPRYSI